jgi:hypothetical protein
MQLIPQKIPGAFTLPNAPVMQDIPGSPNPFGLTQSLSQMASFFFQSEQQKELLKRQSEIERLRATQTERIFQTKGAQFLSLGVVLIGVAIFVYALRSK